MLDDRTGSTREMPPHLGHYLWTPASNRFGWTSLLGVPAGSAVVPPNSVPARVSNLKGLPPAFIGVGSIDLFAPEDIEYAQRLVAAGVAVELNVVPGAFHASTISPRTQACRGSSLRRGVRLYAGPLRRQHEKLILPAVLWSVALPQFRPCGQ